MESVPASEVVAELVFSQGEFSPQNYEEEIQKIKEMSKLEKIRLSGQEKFIETWNQLFEEKSTEWYKGYLPSDTEFVNKIFDSGKGFMTYIGLKHSELVDDYKTGKMPKEHKDIIDKIRKTLLEHPRIIVLTTNFKDYTIFDGGRRAVAFTLEKKPLPVYIGKRDSFSILSYFE